VHRAAAWFLKIALALLISGYFGAQRPRTSDVVLTPPWPCRTARLHLRQSNWPRPVWARYWAGPAAHGPFVKFFLSGNGSSFSIFFVSRTILEFLVSPTSTYSPQPNARVPYFLSRIGNFSCLATIKKKKEQTLHAEKNTIFSTNFCRFIWRIVC
jgi:hypothetical protein